jgi:hypothetical protein
MTTPTNVANFPKYQLKNIEDVTTSNSAAVDYDYLYVGNTINSSGTVTPGNVRIGLADGSSATFYNAPNGKEILGEIVLVYQTGTTATNMVGAKIDRLS